MKIAFDEHVPTQMVRVFKALGLERRFKGFEFVVAKDYAPKPTDTDYIKKSDVPWLQRFASDGGRVVISGNVRMTEVPLEMQALRQLGLTVFFFEHSWNQWDFYQKSALLLVYWLRIIAKIKRGKAGKFWRIPKSFQTDTELRDVSPGKKKIQKDSPHVATRKFQPNDHSRADGADGSAVKTNSKSRKRRVLGDERQTALLLTGGGPRQRA